MRSVYTNVNHHRLRRRALLALVCLAALAVAPVGSHASPGSVQHYAIPIDDVVTTDVCGFPITREDKGTIREDVHTTNSGTVVDAVHFTDWKITLANAANGRSLTSARGYTERDTLYTDGTDYHFEAGLLSHIVIPGQGEVAANAGYLASVFDANGNLISFKIDGPHDGPIVQYACPYLAGN